MVKCFSKKFWILPLLWLFLGISAPSEVVAQKEVPIVLQLRWDHQFQFAGYYAALWQGYYKKAGLNVEIRSAVDDEMNIVKATHEVSEGRAEFGIGAGDILLARDQGAPLTVVASIFQRSPVVVISKPGRSIKTPADVIKLKIAARTPDLATVEFQAMLAAQGIPQHLASLEYTGERIPQLTEKLMDGEIEAVVGYSFPALWAAKQRGMELQVLRPADFGVDFYGDSLFTTELMVRTQPDVVRRFVKASMEGWRYALGDWKQMSHWIATTLPQRFVGKQLHAYNEFQSHLVHEATLHPTVELGHINPDRWERMHSALKKGGLVTRPFDREAFIYRTTEAHEARLTPFQQWAGVLVLVVGGLLAITGLWTIALRRTVTTQTKALRDSKNALDRSQRMVRMGSTVWDRVNMTAFHSEGIFEIYRATPEQLDTFQKFLNFIHPEDKERVNQTLRRALEHPANPLADEFRIVMEDGEIRHFYAEGEVTFDVTGYATRVEITVSDVTERHLAEAKLRESEASLANAQRIAHMGHSEWDIATATGRHSEGAERLLQVTADQVKNYSDFAKMIHPEDRERVFETNAKAIKDPSVPLSYTFRVILHSGEVRHLYVDGEVEFNDEGRGIRVHNTVFDVTERVLAEKKQRETEQLFSQLVEALPVVMNHVDKQLRYVRVNKTLLEWYGRTSEEVVDLTMQEVLGVEMFSKIEPTINRVLAGETVTLTTDIAYPDGKTRHLQIFYVPSRNEEGEVDGIFSLGIDRTDQRGLEERLAHAQRMEAIGNLTGGVAHEFNNLLMAMTGSLGMMEMSLPKDSDMQDMLKIALKAATRGGELTSRLLSFSRRQALIPMAVDLGEILDESLAILRQTAGEHLLLEVDQSQLSSPAMVDPAQLQNAIINLTVNARDAMPEGGRILFRLYEKQISKGNLPVGAELTPGLFSVLEIQDEGCGMSEEVRKMALDPFFTTKGVGEGTGLGLSMVNGFVEQSGGFLELESKLGKGTTVRLFLPSTASEPKKEQPSEQSAKASNGNNGKILVVEDEPLVRDTVTRYLQKLGYELYEADTGEDAVAKFDSMQDIDLVLTDIVMPGQLDGLKFAEEFWKRWPNTPVIFTTGYADNIPGLPDEALSGLTLLKKPYNLATLAKTVADKLAEV